MPCLLAHNGERERYAPHAFPAHFLPLHLLRRDLIGEAVTRPTKCGLHRTCVTDDYLNYSFFPLNGKGFDDHITKSNWATNAGSMPWSQANNYLFTTEMKLNFTCAFCMLNYLVTSSHNKAQVPSSPPSIPLLILELTLVRWCWIARRPRWRDVPVLG